MDELISETKVGSKGELFPSKEIREKLGLKPHRKVILRVEDGKLIVEPIPDLDDLLEMPPIIVETKEEFETDRRGLSRRFEG